MCGNTLHQQEEGSSLHPPFFFPFLNHFAFITCCDYCPYLYMVRIVNKHVYQVSFKAISSLRAGSRFCLRFCLFNVYQKPQYMAHYYAAVKRVVSYSLDWLEVQAANLAK